MTIHSVSRFVFNRFLLVPAGALVALAWANLEPESYFRFAHAGAFPVNEIGMALFLALIAQRVFEAVMPGGALHSWRQWGMSLAAAVGGFAGSAGLYLAYVYGRHETVLTQAWPVACAVDIVAGYYLLRVITKHRAPLAFFLLTAVVIDAAGLAAAMVAPTRMDLAIGAAFMAIALGAAGLFRSLGVRAFWPYLIPGAVSWWACGWLGLYPALALVPIVPFLPHEARTHALLAAPRADDEVHRGERRWNAVVQPVLFLFGLVNAGVVLRGVDTGAFAMVIGTLAGRPLGIIAAVGLAYGLGLRLPAGMGWRELVVVALATASGFTFALFFATSVVPIGAVLTQIKLGALATVAGAVLAVGVARWLHVGRFARAERQA